MPPRVHGDHDVWVVGSHHHTNQFIADVGKVTRVTTLISVYFHWIQDDRNGIARKPPVSTQLIPRVMTEFHARLRALKASSLPL
jgi:Tfp pilus assembly protein PilO